MNYLICLGLVMVILFQPVYSMQIPFDGRIDWYLAFKNEENLARHQQWCKALIDIQRAAASHKKYTISPLFLLPTRDVDLVAVLRDVETYCRAAKIKLIDTSTQNISVFLLWILSSIVTTQCNDTIDDKDLLHLLLHIMNHKPDISIKNADTKVNIAQCIAKFPNKSICRKMTYIIHHGKMPLS